MRKRTGARFARLGERRARRVPSVVARYARSGSVAKKRVVADVRAHLHGVARGRGHLARERALGARERQLLLIPRLPRLPVAPGDARARDVRGGRRGVRERLTRRILRGRREPRRVAGGGLREGHLRRQPARGVRETRVREKAEVERVEGVQGVEARVLGEVEGERLGHRRRERVGSSGASRGSSMRACSRASTSAGRGSRGGGKSNDSNFLVVSDAPTPPREKHLAVFDHGLIDLESETSHHASGSRPHHAIEDGCRRLWKLRFPPISVVAATMTMRCAQFI